MNNKGFSLIEVIVSIAVIVVMVGVVLPSGMIAFENSLNKEVRQIIMLCQKIKEDSNSYDKVFKLIKNEEGYVVREFQKEVWKWGLRLKENNEEDFKVVKKIQIDPQVKVMLRVRGEEKEEIFFYPNVVPKGVDFLLEKDGKEVNLKLNEFNGSVEFVENY